MHWLNEFSNCPSMYLNHIYILLVITPYYSLKWVTRPQNQTDWIRKNTGKSEWWLSVFFNKLFRQTLFRVTDFRTKFLVVTFLVNSISKISIERLKASVNKINKCCCKKYIGWIIPKMPLRLVTVWSNC